MAQYKRSASRGGFSAVQVSRANVQEILRQGERDSKLLKELAKSDLAESKRQNDGANAAFNFETQQQERNYKIVQQNLVQEQAAAQDKALIAQREMEGGGTLAKNLEQFAKLSATAGKMFEDHKKKQDEITKQNDINKYFSDPEYKAAVDAAAKGMRVENNLTASDAMAQRNAADLVSSDKVSVAQMSREITNLSPGQQEAYTRGQANEYPAYIAQWFANAGEEGRAISDDPSLYAQKIQDLRYQFLQERGLNNMSMEALSGSLDGMMRIEGALLSANGDEFVGRQRQKSLQNAYDLVAEMPDVDNAAAGLQASQAWNQILYAKNYNFAEALETFQQMALNAPDGRVSQLLQSVEFSNGKTLRDYPARIKAIQDGRTQNEINDENRLQRAAQAQLTKTNRETGIYDKTRALLEEAEGDPVRTAQIINAAKEEQRRIAGDYNVSDPVLDDILQAGESESARQWQVQFEDDAEKGLLDLAQADVAPDQKSRDAYRQAYAEQESRRYGSNYDEVKTTVAALAQNLTEVPNQPKRNSDSRNPYEGMVQQDLMDQFKIKFDALTRGGATADAASMQALAEVNEMAQKGMLNDPTARYRREIDTSGVTFTAPELSSAFRGPAAVKPEAVNKNIQDPDFPNKKGSVLTEAQLRVASRNYNNRDGSFYIPEVVRRITAANPNLTPIDLINKQVDAYNATVPADKQIPSLADDDYNERMEALDPEAQSIFSNIPELTVRRAARASIRTSSNGGQVLQSSNRMFKDVSPLTQKLVTAIIGKESGGQSDVQNASGSGAVGLGQVMPENVGPWTNQYLGRRMSYEEFRYDPDAQMTVVTGKLNDILQSQLAAGYDEDIAVRRAASIWYSGRGDLYNNTRPQTWNGDSYPSIGSYTQNVLDRVRSIN